jgi:hypothetical protein
MIPCSTAPMRYPQSLDCGLPSHDFMPSSGLTQGSCSPCYNAQVTRWCSGRRIIKSGKGGLRGILLQLWLHECSLQDSQTCLHRSPPATACCDDIPLSSGSNNSKIRHKGDIGYVVEDNGLAESKNQCHHADYKPRQRFSPAVPATCVRAGETGAGARGRRALACPSQECEDGQGLVYAENHFQLIIEAKDFPLQNDMLPPKLSYRRCRYSSVKYSTRWFIDNRDRGVHGSWVLWWFLLIQMIFERYILPG